MSTAIHLRCRSCSAIEPLEAVARCGTCGNQLDVEYDWDQVGRQLTRAVIESRPHDMWRYRELLPLDDAPTVGLHSGWTPLVEAPSLARELGVARLWIKFDGQSFPSLSFKDRVVAVALNRALELEIQTVGCPSTGNLANSVASMAAAAGLDAWVLVPHDIESGKTIGSAVYGPRLIRVQGTYDDINRLATQAAMRFGWGMVNINLRPYYGEGSKTMAFEIVEQLGWRLPTAVVCPMAGGLLITKLHQGFGELVRLGLVDGEKPRINGVQASGSAPIVEAFNRGTDQIVPVRPRTLARSIAIGNPVDGRWAVSAMRSSRGRAVAVTDEEMIHGIRILAEHTGVFTETAGGVTLAGTMALARDGALTELDEVVLCITGNGMKTAEVLAGQLPDAPLIPPELDALASLT